MLDFHKDNKADATIAVMPSAHGRGAAVSGIMNTDDNDQHHRV